ncbi:putative porin [Marinigracilibium pacificum]|uniref:Putative porin n=1 Tax=Marinigracilibium pacificum TaxID=2729599 RepID=A0A848J0F9_9BACT|nr:putative porin [Marinigracilibium pacificum]NMM47964.1 putative porin [Marinigracilibium pacificum]
MKLEKVVFFIFLIFIGFDSYSQIQTPRGSGMGRDEYFDMNEDTVSVPDEDDGKLKLDSAKNPYGPLTLYYIKAQDVKNSKDIHYRIDSTLADFGRFEKLELMNYEAQNLGNMATAIFDLYPDLPETPGLRSGFIAYQPYVVTPYEHRFFNTKGPYTEVNVLFGGGNRNKVDIAFARNVNERFNIGFNLGRIAADKNLGPVRRFDNQGVVIAYDVNANFINKDSTYSFMTRIFRHSHKVSESGGVFDFANEAIAEQALNDQSQISPALEGAGSNYRVFNGYFLQTYRPTGILRFYHEFEYNQERNTFVVQPTGDNLSSGFFNNIYLDDENTYDRVFFTTLKNEAGLTGGTERIFYRAYFKHRHITIDSEQLNGQTTRNELFAGGYLSYDLNERNKLFGTVEYLIGQTYNIDAMLQTDWVEAGFRRLSYKPDYVFQKYLGNHRAWENDFDDVTADDLYGRIKVKLGNQKISPYLSIKNYNNYVYYSSDTIPVQFNENFQVLTAGVDLKFLLFKHLGIELDGKYSLISDNGKSVYRVPDLFGNGSIYYQNELFKGAMIIKTGVSANYRSGFYAMAYDPTIQRYFVQNAYQSKDYIIADFFLNFQVDRWRFSLKLKHFNQGLINNGYYITPAYPVQGRVFDFGVSWLFFD